MKTSKLLTVWDNTYTPLVAVEEHEVNSISVFWGALIPAIPDLVALEQNQIGMSYETAIKTLLNSQKQWIQQLHGDDEFSISLRIIKETSDSDLIFGLVGKVLGKERSNAIKSARYFYNKVRDTFPNGYLLEVCNDPEELVKLRLPFLPESIENNQKSYAEFRRNLTKLTTINDSSIPGKSGFKIDVWFPQNGTYQSLFRALVCHTTPVAIAINLKPATLSHREISYLAEQSRLYANIASITKSTSSQNRIHSQGLQYQDKLIEAEQASQAWEQLRNNWRSPFEMSINILSVSDVPQSLIAALQSEIDGEPDHNESTGKVRSGGGHVIYAETEAQKIAIRQNWADLALHRWGNTYNLDRLPWLFSPEEVHCLFIIAHRLLVQAIYDPHTSQQTEWLSLSSFPETLITLNLVHPEYKNCEAPGAFRYEAKIILISQDNFIQYLEETSESAGIALINWITSKFPFLCSFYRLKF